MNESGKMTEEDMNEREREREKDSKLNGVENDNRLDKKKL